MRDAMLNTNSGVYDYRALHLIKPFLKKPLLVMQSKVVGTDFFISLRVQNIPVYKATLQYWLLFIQSIQVPLSRAKVANLARLV